MAIVSQPQSTYVTNGESIRILRDRAGYSLRGFAHKVGTDPSHLSRIERGAGQPSNSLRRRIAEHLGVDPSDISDLPPPPARAAA